MRADLLARCPARSRRAAIDARPRGRRAPRLLRGNAWSAARRSPRATSSRIARHSGCARFDVQAGGGLVEEQQLAGGRRSPARTARAAAGRRRACRSAVRAGRRARPSRRSRRRCVARRNSCGSARAARRPAACRGCRPTAASRRCAGAPRARCGDWPNSVASPASARDRPSSSADRGGLAGAVGAEQREQFARRGHPGRCHRAPAPCRMPCGRRAGLPASGAGPTSLVVIAAPRRGRWPDCAARVGGVQSRSSAIAHDKRQVTLRGEAAYALPGLAACTSRIGPRSSHLPACPRPSLWIAMNSSADLLKELRIDRSAPPPSPSRRGLWIALAMVVALLVVAGAAWAWFGRDKGVEVHTATVVAIGNGGASSSVLDATGYVVARRMATVSSKITGKVREVLIEEGQHVQAGQVLATLDPIDADAERDLASRAARRRAQPDRQRAGAAARSRSQRRAPGVAGEAAAGVEVAVRPGRRAARFAARATAPPRSATRRSPATSCASPGNGVDNTVVRAPFAGVVIAKAAQPGEIVSPLSAGGGFTRTGIGTIVDMDSLEVEVDVGEAYIGRVQPNMPVEVDAQRLSRLEDPGQGHRDHPDRRPRQGHGQGARRRSNVNDPRIVPDMGVRVSFLEAAKPRRRRSQPQGVLRAGGGDRAARRQDVVFAWSTATASQQRASRPASRWATTARCCPGVTRRRQRGARRRRTTCTTARSVRMARTQPATPTQRASRGVHPTTDEAA